VFVAPLIFKTKAMNSKKIFQGIIVLVVFSLIHIVSLGQVVVTDPIRINFTSFTVNSNQKGIKIDWATDNKKPTNYFEIERSSDGINFETIALVLGPDPKQPRCDCYESFDKPKSKAKKYFYRLKHVSVDGEIELSETKTLAMNK
jgi:hypothetical protein